MTMESIDRTPEVAEILQDVDVAEQAVPPLPVVVAAPAPVKLLPGIAAGMLSYDLVTTAAVQILSRDPRRKRAVLVGFTAQATCRGARLGPTPAGASFDRAFLFASALAAGGFPACIEYTSTDELWAVADTQVCTVSVLNEQWAD